MQRLSPAALLAAARSLLAPAAAPQAAHKGSRGKVLVVGGGTHYSGAPYFAATAALRGGADLAWVVCEQHLAPTIRGYNPDLIVVPFETPAPGGAVSLEPFVPLLQRCDAVVVGPGLGRAGATLALAGRFIEACRAALKPVVIDGDGLFLVSQSPSLVTGHPTAVLTPNPVEFQRIKDALGIPREEEANSALVKETAAVAAALGGVAILRKGAVDAIVAGTTSTSDEGGDAASALCDSSASPRRAGGQGDLLAGLTGLLLARAAALAARQRDGSDSDTSLFAGGVTSPATKIAAAWTAAVLVRAASALTWNDEGEAASAAAMLRHVAPAAETVFGLPRQRIALIEAFPGAGGALAAAAAAVSDGRSGGSS